MNTEQWLARIRAAIDAGRPTFESRINFSTDVIGVYIDKIDYVRRAECRAHIWFKINGQMFSCAYTRMTICELAETLANLETMLKETKE